MEIKKYILQNSRRVIKSDWEEIKRRHGDVI